MQHGTGVQLLTVEQDCLLLGADVKHSEVQNLFSSPNEKKRKKKKVKKGKKTKQNIGNKEKEEKEKKKTVNRCERNFGRKFNRLKYDNV